MLSGSPHSGRIPTLERVICRQSPGLPAQMSGGMDQELRTAALAVPSSESAMSSVSGPFQIRSVCPVARSNMEIAVSPATCSVKSMRCDDGSHWNQFGDDLRLGVKSLGVPPLAASV